MRVRGRRTSWSKQAAQIAAVVLAGEIFGLRMPAQNSTAPAPSPVNPPWAYPVTPAGFQPPPDDGIPKRLTGSNAAFTLTQLRDVYTAHDWYPGDHPLMPDVVARGRKPDVLACAMCHLPNGQGRPENASLAGLPAAYIVQQMADFQAGRRKCSEPGMLPQNLMMTVGRNATVNEAKAAAVYFARLKYKPWIRVVETDSVPKTEVITGSMLAPVAGAGTEPIGQRIIETAEDLPRTELRDPRSGFVAYVPAGSIKKGGVLVNTGGGRTVQCTNCHGDDLKGLMDIPGLAGRSPSYVVRQLLDMQNGARAGAEVLPMKEVVARLTLDDIIAIAAYTASLTP